MEKVKILIVDDHAILRDGIKALLSIQEDFEIIGEASNGKEAVLEAQNLNPDIIIMDIAMPDMDGLEATKRIKKRNQDIKVIALTQHDKKEYMISAIKAGISGYVPKKALGTDLVKAIQSVYNGEPFLYPSVTATLIETLSQQSDVEPFEKLTPREREIMKLIAEGKTSRQIADFLFISLKTVLNHRSKIMEKLNIHNHSSLIKYAIRRGLISLNE